METNTLIDSDETLQRVLAEHQMAQDQASQGMGLKSGFTFVLCPEKDLVLAKKEESKVEEPVKVPEKKVKIQIVAKETLIEEEAIKQLQIASCLKGCTHAFGMPDLHPGKGIPIGASIITQGIVFPELVDYDIGCGMSFIRTGI